MKILASQSLKIRYPNLDAILEEIGQMKRFGEGLGLSYDDNFTRINPWEEKFSFFLFASFQDRIKSAIFNGEGDPFEEFKGDKVSAEKRDQELQSKGLDTYLEGAVAEGGSDGFQISQALLEATSASMAYFIFHEGYHCHAKKLGIHNPIHLDEPLAHAFGLKATVAFFKADAHADADFSVLDNHRYAEFCRFVNYCHDFISKSYASGKADRAALFNQAQQKYTKKYGVPPDTPINNAYLLRHRLYAKHFELVMDATESLLAKDFIPNIKAIHRSLVEKISSN